MKTRATLTTTAAPQHSSATGASVTEASKMLEAALQQMDGIISGSSSGGVAGGGGGVEMTTGGGSAGVHSNGTPSNSAGVRPSIAALNEHNLISATNVLSTAKTLALALQQVGIAVPAPDAVTAGIISDWLETYIPRQDADERLRRLQRDKEALAVQFQTLTERFALQSDKVIELERQLAERTQQLSVNEAALQRQMLSQSALETQKLELMSALSELKLHRAALERENVELKGTTTVDGAVAVALSLKERGGSNGDVRERPPRHPFGSVGNIHQSSATSSSTAPKTPPAALRHQIHPQFHSLPRSHGGAGKPSAKQTNNNNNNNNNNSSTFDSNANASSKQRNVVFASNEKIIDDAAANTDMYGSFISQLNSSPSPNLRERSAKGLRNIFGKLRRSNSGSLELPALEQADMEFRRGGARATAGGRIEWTAAQNTSVASSSAKGGYADWTPQEVCNWLCDLGLGCYEEECRKWLKSNTSINFFTASPLDIEKELNLKTPLHRKKIMLAMDELTGKEDDALALKAAQLDVSWVLRWLDDIGLPQYKDSFLQAKLDGRVLHRLTLEDLTHLHVSSCLHIASLRRGIQCMRANAWNPECLIRRSTTRRPPLNDSDENDDRDAAADDDDHEERSECVALWTAHRVMEWLRVADLSEYAPNLRGAGVHGALMLYEPRFNADLLANLLSIPPSKTLLRRHLATHFKELLGRDVIHGKRDAEAAPSYQPLTIAAKIKAPKKPQFSLKRRKSTKGSSDIEWSDYVCPMMTGVVLEEQATNTSSTTSSSTSTNNSGSLNSN